MATIHIENKAGIKIDLERLDTIVREAALPEGAIVFVFNDAPLPGGNQGVCTPKALMKFSREYSDVCRGKNVKRWDVCVAIAQKFCLMSEEFPAYFAYLLGHELGHAKICLKELNLHVFCCLVYSHIKTASNDQITLPHEVPHEILFDQFGIYLAEKLYPRTVLNEEIQRLMDKSDCNSIERQHLEMMLSLSPLNNFDLLRDNLIEFTKPYKTSLISSWKKCFKNRGHDSLTSLIKDYVSAQ